MKKIATNKEQMQKLREYLGTGYFDVSVFPETREMFKNKILDTRNLGILSEQYDREDKGIGKARKDFGFEKQPYEIEMEKDLSESDTYYLELDRDLKICILECLQSGYFPIQKAMPTFDKDLKRNWFLEVMQAATSEKTV